MYKPNYKQKNIINLMSSISSTLGVESSYNKLELSEFKQFKNIVLIVIDGLGYNYLMGQDSFLKRNTIDKLEGAFPLTTAASNTAFSYGVPVQQHGLPGWFVYLKEVGAITTILPFTERYFGSDLAAKGFNINKIIGIEPFTKYANRKSYKVLDNNYAFSAFSKASSEGSQIFGVKPFTETLEKVSELCQIDEEKYVHAYIGDFDTSGHSIGIEHEKTEKIFHLIDKQIEKLSNEVSDTIIFVTADHGMKDTDEQHTIKLSDYPELESCLSQPLSGDSRIGYCYVRNGYDKKFMQVFNRLLGDKAYIFKSESMIDNNWFGLGEVHPMLRYRLGDFTILTKDKYMLYDNLGNEERIPIKGHHSGISDDEVFVPLIEIRR